MSELMITPETRVGALLDAHPELEVTLIGIAPTFKALKNPVLRRTVAKVATLEQAARIADLTAFFMLGELVEFNDSTTMFTNPDREITEEDITGRFG